MPTDDVKKHTFDAILITSQLLNIGPVIGQDLCEDYRPHPRQRTHLLDIFAALKCSIWRRDNVEARSGVVGKQSRMDGCDRWSPAHRYCQIGRKMEISVFTKLCKRL